MLRGDYGKKLNKVFHSGGLKSQMVYSVHTISSTRRIHDDIVSRGVNLVYKVYSDSAYSCRVVESMTILSLGEVNLVYKVYSDSAYSCRYNSSNPRRQLVESMPILFLGVSYTTFGLFLLYYFANTTAFPTSLAAQIQNLDEL